MLVTKTLYNMSCTTHNIIVINNYHKSVSSPCTAQTHGWSLRSVRLAMPPVLVAGLAVLWLALTCSSAGEPVPSRWRGKGNKRRSCTTTMMSTYCTYVCLARVLNELTRTPHTDTQTMNIHTHTHTHTHSSLRYYRSVLPAHWCLNITRDFGPHGRLPRIKVPYVCIEAATVAPWNAVHGCLSGSGHLPGTLRYTHTLYTHTHTHTHTLFIAILERVVLRRSF